MCAPLNPHKSGVQIRAPAPKTATTNYSWASQLASESRNPYWVTGWYVFFGFDLAEIVLFQLFPSVARLEQLSDMNNNKMKRLNRETRDREKVVRGLKKPEPPIIPGYRIYHNYVRPHEALEGKTPAEACGIKVEGQDKWLTLIQNASKPRDR